MKYSKILIFSGISCVVGLIFVFGFRLQAQNAAKKEIVIAKANQMKVPATLRIDQFKNHQQGLNWNVKGRSKSVKSGDNSDFYKVIVENNIFRPLGWRPPKREPEYAFIGTRIDPTGTLTEAYILEQRSNQFYIAKIGDKVGDAIVKEIEQKEITLNKNGETITLRGGNMQFLKSGGSRRSSPSRSESSNRNESSSNNRSSSSKSFDKEAAMKKAKEEAMKKMQEMRGKFKSVSPGDRDKIIRQLKESGILKGNSKVVVTFDK